MKQKTLKTVDLSNSSKLSDIDNINKLKDTSKGNKGIIKTALLTLSAVSVITGCGGGGSRPSNSGNVISEIPESNITSQEDTNISSPGVQEETDNTRDQVEEVVSLVSEEEINEYLDKVNEYRSQTQDCGEEGIFEATTPLTWNNSLGNSALEHSEDMAKADFFSHEGSGTKYDITAQELDLGRGSYFYERDENNGYNNYISAGENIAAGQPDSDIAFDDLINSPHHCANIMNPDVDEFGMAKYENNESYYKIYWTQEFGKRYKK